jgi:hypothetical protein
LPIILYPEIRLAALILIREKRGAEALEINGASDGTRTRDLLRDREAF